MKTEAKGGKKRSFLRGRRIGVYPGQYYDSETGLHYNYFRYYNPQTGRYITPDPIGLEGGINLFVYVQNNPVNKIDLMGLTDRYTYCEGKPGCKESTDAACNSSVQAALLCCDYDYKYCLMDAGFPACDEADIKKCEGEKVACQFKARHAGPKKDREPLKPLPVPDNPPYPGNPKSPYPPY